MLCQNVQQVARRGSRSPSSRFRSSFRSSSTSRWGAETQVGRRGDDGTIRLPPGLPRSGRQIAKASNQIAMNGSYEESEIVETRRRSCINFSLMRPARENSKIANAERIKTRRTAWWSPARHAEQENSSEKCGHQRRRGGLEFVTSGSSIGPHEGAQSTPRTSYIGGTRGAALRPFQAARLRPAPCQEIWGS